MKFAGRGGDNYHLFTETEGNSGGRGATKWNTLLFRVSVSVYDSLLYCYYCIEITYYCIVIIFSSMKNKSILIIGIVVGKPHIRMTFNHTILKMSSSNSTLFNYDFLHLDKILDRLINASCTSLNSGKFNQKLIWWVVNNPYIRCSVQLLN
jgi:hypothetical protein